MDLATEPARIISIVTAFVTAAIGAAAAFGLDIDDAQRNAILAVVAPAVTVIIVLGELIRSRVVSPASAGEAVALAKNALPFGQAEYSSENVIPEIKVANYKAAVVDNLPATVDERTINWRPTVANA